MNDKRNKNKQDFLLTFFDGEGYQEKEVNGFFLVKQWNKYTKEWNVAIFTREGFTKRKQFLQSWSGTRRLPN